MGVIYFGLRICDFELAKQYINVKGSFLKQNQISLLDVGEGRANCDPDSHRENSRPVVYQTTALAG